MTYIHHTNCSSSKKISKALVQIYGIGSYQSLQICDLVGICPETKLSDCTSQQIAFISQIIAQNYDTGLEMKRQINQNIQKYIQIASYRGFRHVQGLPVRGQSTRRNHKTARKIKHFK